ncbi:MAG: BatA domain-containing protein [Bacteroidales bacterium]|jgi:hypothetical protein
MSFLYPNFLWALTAVLIPVIIHLFSFRRHKTVYFSQTRFLESVRKESRSKTTLKQLLILLSRILAIAMLVMAFAQPVILPEKDEIAASQSPYVVVCIDNSFSMQNEGSSGSLLNIAKQKATEIAEAYGQEVQFFLITNNMPPRFYRPLSYDEFLSEVSQIEVSPVSVHLSKTMEKLRRITSSYVSDKAPCPVYFISDFQVSTTDFVVFDDIKHYDLKAILIEGIQQENLSIDSVWFASPFRQAGKPEQLNVLVRNHGSQSYNDIPVNLKLNDSLRAVSSLNIESNASTVLMLNFTNPQNGIQRAELELDDYPVSFDNSFYFTYNLEKEKSILLVNGSDPTDFPVSVYDDETRFDLKQIEEDDLDMSAMDKYNMLVFNGFDYISEGMAAQLNDLTEKGVVMVFIPGTDMHTDSWNNFLQNLKGPRFSTWDSTSRKLSEIAWEHPFFKGVFSGRQENVELPVIHGMYPMHKSQTSMGEDLLLFENELPFLKMLSVENALIYLFSSPLNADYGNFVKHALFIPVAYNMAMNTPTARKLYFISGQEAGMMVRSQTNGNETSVEIRSNKSDNAIIPSWRITSGGVRVFVPAALFEPGHYDVIVNDVFTDAFALNINPLESDMDFYDAKSLKSAAETRNFEFSNLYEADTLDMAQKIKEKEQGKALWPWFLMAVLFFIVIEIMLIKWM